MLCVYRVGARGREDRKLLLYFPTVYLNLHLHIITLSGSIPTDRLDLYLNLNQLLG
jgi:hypothetical protein